MKLLVLVLGVLMTSVSAQAETFKTEFLVTSQKGTDYWVRVILTDIDAQKATELQKVVEEIMVQTAGQFSKAGFLSNRMIAINRIQKTLKKNKLACDGVGILGLVKKGEEVVDIE